MNRYQSTNFEHKTDFLVSNDTSLSQQVQIAVKSKRAYQYEKCPQCKKSRRPSKGHKICHVCYKSNTLFKPIGNKIIDDFIKYTQYNDIRNKGKMEFVPYDQFKDIEFIAEGGFSKVYKATWIDGPIINFNSKKQKYNRKVNKQVALKKLNDSKNITSKELNEVQNIPKHS